MASGGVQGQSPGGVKSEAPWTLKAFGIDKIYN